MSKRNAFLLAETKLKASAEQHPQFSALCILPDGRIIMTAAAEAQGVTVLAAGVPPDPAIKPPRPLPTPLAAVPSPLVALPTPAAVVADRARMVALIAMTAKGTEAEAECQDAIRMGATPEQYASTAAARSILDAMASLRQ